MSEPGDLRAAEYVLGTLPLSERIEFQALIPTHVAIREAVLEWETRLSPLAGAVKPVEPPPHVWDNILAALPPDAAERPQLYAIDGDQTNREKTALVKSRSAWRVATLAASAVAGLAIAACVALLIVGPQLISQQNASQGSFVAAVNQGGDKPALIVRVDMASGKVYVRPVSVEAPPGRDLELWFVNYGKAPQTMGVLGKEPETKKIPPGATMEKASLAVSVEPKGGSSTGQPTGPVVYSGDLVRD